MGSRRSIAIRQQRLDLVAQPDQYAETIMLDNAFNDESHYPAGQYTLLYDGQGSISFDLQSATIVSQTPAEWW